MNEILTTLRAAVGAANVLSEGDLSAWELDWRTMTMHWTEEAYRLHGVAPDSFVPSLKGMLGFYVPD